MKYLHEFVSRIDFLRKYFGDDYLQPWASLTTSNYQSDYNRKKRKLSKMPLTTVPLTNDSTTFTFAIAANVNTDTLQSISYSVDGGETWTTTANVDATAVNITATVTNKTPVMWKGVGKAISVSDTVYSRLYANKNFEAFGNPLSLIGEQYNLKSLINNAWALAHLFHNATTLINADKLILSAKKCGERCYHKMFDSCSNLETFPTLPAISLANGCYAYMFSMCKKMVTPVAVPATKLDQYCYTYMFNGCTGLTSIPELPAMNLYQYCYQSMFQGCTSLTTCPALPATTLALSCYNAMFKNCTSLTNPPALPATILVSNCYVQMFASCTSLVNAPNLPATTVAPGCYANMFNGCTSITTMPTINLTAMQINALKGMMRGCTSLVNVPDILPWTTLVSGCFQELFYGCTSLAKAPKLPAQTLVVNCYNSMFYNCSNINSITALFITTPNSVTNCNANWVYGVSATGTFTMSGNAEWNPESYRGVNGVPEGWTINRITPTLETDDGNTTYAISSSANQISINGTNLLTGYNASLNDPDNVFTVEKSDDDTYDITCSDHTALHTAILTVSSPGATNLVLILVNNDGTLPNGYKRVGCVEADGNQQVDLNLIMFETAPVDYGVQLIGYLDNTSAAYGTLLANLSETNPYPGTAIRKSNNTAFVQTRVNRVQSNITSTNTLFATNYTGTESSAFNCKTTLFGAINTTNGNWWRFGKGKIYGCKIFINNTLVRNLIPCIENATNIVGLYDVVNNVFYTSETNPLTYTN